MATLNEKARELSNAIHKKQQMITKQWPQVAIHDQELLILILAAQLDGILDEEEPKQIPSPTIPIMMTETPDAPHVVWAKGENMMHCQNCGNTHQLAQGSIDIEDMLDRMREYAINHKDCKPQTTPQ